MRYAFFALALAAACDARVAQVEKRDIITLTKYIDIWKTIFMPAQAAPTPAASAAPSLKASIRPSVAAPSAVASPIIAAAGASKAPSSKPFIFSQPSAAPSALPSAVVSPAESSDPDEESSAPGAASSVVFQPVPSSVASAPSSVAPIKSSPVVAASSAAPAAAAASGSGMTQAYMSDVISHHNAHRSNHSAPGMVWNETLATRALEIAKTCDYGHVTDNGAFGQNIAAGMPVSRIGFVISDQFYNGEVNSYTYYGQATPDMDNFHKYGHFTAVVWVKTTSVGCASYDCSKTGLLHTAANVPPIFHVCNYGPTGNVIGRFDTNVLPSLNNPTIHG